MDWREATAAINEKQNVKQCRQQYGWSLRSAVAVLLALCAATVSSADEVAWEHAPYRIHALLAIDAPGGLSAQLHELLPEYLGQRIHTSIGPVWSFDTELATGGSRHRILTGIATASEEPSESFSAAGDKLLLLSVRATPLGYELTGREYDRYLERWGLPVRRTCRQLGALPEQLFALVWQVVAPLVRLELDPQDEHRIVLLPRGAGLPRKSPDVEFARPGDIFLPALRRITREGEVVPDGIEFVPWTYIETAPPSEDGVLAGQIHSGTRRPFGVRRRGRIEQVAIALRSDPANTAVRLHSRTDPNKPLVDYDVFTKNTSESTTAPLGSSDTSGRIIVPPGKSRVQLLYVKHGGALLARFPIVPGAQPQVDVPLPDDDIRLQAEARLAALREELVDVVARRNILMSRVKQDIEDRDFDDAQTLLVALDQLPGRSQFNQQLSREARLHRSDDPQIQQRIDRLIATTQVVLSQYLDTRQVSDLHDELRAAKSGGS